MGMERSRMIERCAYRVCMRSAKTTSTSSPTYVQLLCRRFDPVHLMLQHLLLIPYLRQLSSPTQHGRSPAPYKWFRSDSMAWSSSLLLSLLSSFHFCEFPKVYSKLNERKEKRKLNSSIRRERARHSTTPTGWHFSLAIRFDYPHHWNRPMRPKCYEL